jgi:pSer/pThr/pTyr-binding forkhead associated (FHA) protein
MTALHPENVPLPANQSEDLRHGFQVALKSDGAEPSLPGLADRPSAATGGNEPVSERALPILRILSFGKPPRDHVLAVGRNTVGRHPDNDVVISSPYVSRRHCAILVLPDGSCILQDLGSTDGVYVDGERIKHPLRLKADDEIHVGGRRLVLLASVNGTASTEPAE